MYQRDALIRALMNKRRVIPGQSPYSPLTSGVPSFVTSENYGMVPRLPDITAPAPTAAPVTISPPAANRSPAQPQQYAPIAQPTDIRPDAQKAGQIAGFNAFVDPMNARSAADMLTGGDMSKLKARTYYDEEGNGFNDYYSQSLFGGK